MECSTCHCEFDIDTEGGTSGELDPSDGNDGNFGMIPVSFCPTCLCCLLDMAKLYFTDEDEEPNLEFVTIAALIEEMEKRCDTLLIAARVPGDNVNLRMLTKTPMPDTKWGYNTYEMLKLVNHIQSSVFNQSKNEELPEGS